MNSQQNDIRSQRLVEGPVIKAREIRKSFADIEVLRDMSLEAHRGDVVSLIGASGSGRSTFLRCLNFLETFQGADALSRSSDKLRRLRREVGRVGQSFNFWPHMDAAEKRHGRTDGSPQCTDQDR